MRQDEIHAYSPYGYSRTISANSTILGYNGEYFLAHAMLYILGNGHRAYSPLLTRFYSPDAVSPFAEGGINTYVYCNGDPINSIDPSGHVTVAVLAMRRNAHLKLTLTPIPGPSRSAPRYKTNRIAVTRNRNDLGLPSYQSAVASRERPSYISPEAQQPPAYTKHPRSGQATLTQASWKNAPSQTQLSSMKKELALNRQRISTYSEQINAYQRAGLPVSSFQEIVNTLEIKNEGIELILRQARLARELRQGQ